MMAKVVQLLIFMGLRCVVCVPPSPTSAVTDLIKAEFATMKNTIKVLSDQWEKWNTLFLTSLEPRITSTASTLASIDSNIHNLQERAHVWDTFQLHVSAWNEQLASIDRKMDIISKGQEKVFNLDGKLNAILNMEYKLDNTIKLLNNIYDSVANIHSTVKEKKSRDSLFNEFATKGVLSSIKLVERKLDRLLITNQNNLLKPKVSDEKPKFTIKCNTPRILEELLNDISSKVDIILDNTSSSTFRSDSDDTDYDSEYLDIGEGSGGDIDVKQISKNKHLKKAIRQIVQPCKETNQVLEEILNRAVRIENASLIILDKENTNFEKLSKGNSGCKPSYITKSQTEFIENVSLILESFFSEQKAHFESIASRLSKKCDVKADTTISTSKSTETSSNIYSTTTESLVDDKYGVTSTTTAFIMHHAPTWAPITKKNRFSCKDLENNIRSGVYIFENNAKGAKNVYNKRYCEIRDDGKWSVIQRRDNYYTQHNFNVTWDDYKYGFGDLHTDFWMGNDFLATLSNNSDLVLRIVLEDFENHTAWAEYSTFRVLSENDNYRLIVDGYSGNASDSFSSHNGSQFSTFDRINDAAPECCPCAVSYGGGWWFNKCFESNLNGVYYRKPNDNDYFQGLIWESWLGNYSLKKTVMMVKLKDSDESENLLKPRSDMETMQYYEYP